MAPTTSTLQEQFGVANNAVYWDVGDFRLWQSVDPNIILYVPRRLQLSKDTSERYNMIVTQTQRWQRGSYELTGGAATLSVFGHASSDVQITREVEDQWTRVVRNMGYTGTARPRFLPLPVREVRLVGIFDATYARVVENSTSNESRTLVIDLTAIGAHEWGRAIRDKATVPGGICLSYTFPQMMPQASATVMLRGSRVYAYLATKLRKANDGTLYGSAGDIREAWSVLVRTGAVNISLMTHPSLEPTDSHPDLHSRLSDQACEQLFDSLFVPYTSHTADNGLLYAFRWRTPADVTDFGMTITVEGWTWLSTRLEVDLSTLLNTVDESYIHTVYESVSVPVFLVIEPSQTATSVAVSLNFSEGHSPEASVFDATGGTRQFLLSTRRPETVEVSYRMQVNFKPSNWPVLEVSGIASVTSDGCRVVIQPESWIRHHTLYMYVRRGTRILSPAQLDPTDYLTVTATYQASYLASPIRATAPISTQGPIEFSYPVPQGTQAGQATLRAIGMLSGQLVRTTALNLHETEDSVYLLVDGSQLQIVGRNTITDESDPLINQLRLANARPVVIKGLSLSSEDTKDVDVTTDVPLIPQPTDVSCWAAALAMVVSARDSASMDPYTIASRADMDVDTGYDWTDIRRAVDSWNLIEEGPRNAMPEDWARLLKQWGPIWIVEIGAPYHAVVLSGVHGDGTPEGTVMTVHNPWPPSRGMIEAKSFLEFDREFSLGAEAEAAMVHARR